MSLFFLLIFVVVVLNLICGSPISRSSTSIEKPEKPFIFRQHRTFINYDKTWTLIFEKGGEAFFIGNFNTEEELRLHTAKLNALLRKGVDDAELEAAQKEVALISYRSQPAQIPRRSYGRF